MICRKLSVVALSGLTAALSLSAMAQDMTTSSSTTTTTTTMGSGMSMEPMQVTGTVQRYYTDRSGFVTAMDVQTAEGTRMVRFSPGMAQRVYSTYPVGGQITGTVQPSMSMGSSRYDLVGIGDQMPAAGMMTPNMVSDIEMLKADPYIMAGTGMTQFTGKLNSLITDDRGEILALVLSGVNMPGMMNASTDASMTGGAAGGAMGSDMASSTASNTMSTGTMMDGGMMGMMQNMTIVRVPRELRHPAGAQHAGSDRVSPLFKGSRVEVVGYNEAPRYGAVSAYAHRVAASALVVNGRAVGAVGLPRIVDRQNSLLSLNIGGSRSQEEMNAMNLGYSTYGMSTGSGMSGGSDSSMTNSTTGGM